MPSSLALGLVIRNSTSMHPISVILTSEDSKSISLNNILLHDDTWTADNWIITFRQLHWVTTEQEQPTLHKT